MSKYFLIIGACLLSTALFAQQQQHFTDAQLESAMHQLAEEQGEHGASGSSS